MNIQTQIEKHTNTLRAKSEKRNKLQGKLEAAEEALAAISFDSTEEAEKYVEKTKIEVAKEFATLTADLEEFENVYAQYLA